MPIEDEALQLAKSLDEATRQGGAFLEAADCELAAKALRWFALIAEKVGERFLEDGPVPADDTLSSRRQGLDLKGH